MTRIILLASFLSSICLLSVGQEHVEGSLEGDVVSRYLWRGTDKGGPTLLPVARLSWQGLSLRVQGATGVRGADASEVNIGLGYSKGVFRVGVTDYWTTGREYSGRDLYFDFDPHTGGHQLEASLGIDMGFCRLDACTMVWGNDYKYDTEADTEARTNGRRAFSTYFELGVPFGLGGLQWYASAGMTPFQGAYGTSLIGNYHGLRLYQRDCFYSDGAACVMAAVRAAGSVRLGKVSLPVYVEVHANPYLQKVWCVLGLHVASQWHGGSL